MTGVFEALAHPIRRRVLELLRDGDLSAGELAAHFEVTKPTMSGHFRVLKDAGLMHGDRDGSTIRYSLNLSLLEESLLALLKRVGTARGGDGR